MTEFNHRDKLIVKSNTLIESKYHLSVREQKFLIYLASLVKKDDTDYKYTCVKIKNIEAALKGSDDKKWGSIYEVVREVVLSINKKPISIRKPNGGWTIINWFSAVDADPSEGLVTFELSNMIKSQLVMLNEYFTKYRFGNVLALKSGYSIRIYELLKLNQYRGHITYELGYFRELIGVSYMDENKERVHKYPEYKAFKRSVLKHAQKELKRETDIYFELKEEREGRSVKYLTFYVFKNKPKKKKTQTELFITPDTEAVPDDGIPYNKDVLAAFVEIGLTAEKAKELYRSGFNTIENEEIRKQIVLNGRTVDEYFLEKTDYVNFHINNGEVQNPPGLLIKAIKENYQSKAQLKKEKAKTIKQKKEAADNFKKEQQEKLKEMQRSLYQKELAIIENLIKGTDKFLEMVFADDHPELWPGYDLSKNVTENYYAASGSLKAKFTNGVKKKRVEHFTELDNDVKAIESFRKQIRLL